MYGKPPVVIGGASLHPSEMCFVQYMPIKIDGSDIRIPDRLKWTMPIINECSEIDDFEYAYLTAKYIWVNNANMGNRKGWHSDGFLSDDISVIWSDCCPTEFALQGFNLTLDHDKSMQEMAKQVRRDSIVTYPPNSILRLDQYVIHRVSEQPYEGMRAFVKVNMSNNQYNLEGNARNELFDYEWEMSPRKVTRNHPTHIFN